MTPAPRAGLDYRVLGPVEVSARGEPVELGRPLERALLARLLLAAGQVVSVEQIVESLWHGEPPESAAVSVRVRISRLRKALAAAGSDSAIRTQPPGYALVLAPGDSLDSACFAELAQQGRAARRAGDDHRAAEALAAALALWRGPALADVTDAPFARAEVARLDEERLAVLEERIDADLALGRHRELVGELDSLAAQNPFRERLWAQRMVALYRCGRQGDALAAFQALRRCLRDELGIDPSAELSALESQILHQDPSLSATPGARAPARPPAGLPTGVVTFLLTDIEGSTELWERSSQAMAAALARHDELIATWVQAHGGCVIKSKGEGDSTLSVFRRATDAAAAALDLRRAIAGEAWPGGIDLRVRAALHTGEAHERDGDYFGPAVNRAARLRSLVAGGQILLSRVTADVARDQLPDGAELVDLGDHALRGLGQAERVFELRVEEAMPARQKPARPPLPDAVDQGASGPFVGRDVQLRRLEALLAAIATGAAHAAFISGEPGIGKTRLASELARRAYEGGAVVLYGRSDEDSVFPYQPFVEALRQYVGVAAPALRRDLPGAADLAHLLPELGSSRLAATTPEDADSARYKLFDAVAAALAHAARDAPVVLVLDDLHWADRPTLQLLRHVLRVGRRTSLLVVGTYRESDLVRTRPFAEMLADLRRESAFERIALRGLSEDDVVRLLEESAEHDVGRRGRKLARVLAETTDGNPFFMAQIIGNLIETAGIRLVDGRWVMEERLENLSIPEGVLEAVGRRLSRLSEACNRTLAAASVLGRTFEIDVLARMIDVDPDAVLTAIEEAIAAGLVRELPEQARATCMFTHALVQQALYAELTLARKQRLHLRAGDAIEAVHAADIATHVPALAVHLRAAGAAASPERAIDHSVRAMESTWRAFAYEEAIAHGEAALELMDEHGVEPFDRARLLERLGDVHLVAGTVERGLACLEDALTILESQGSEARAARIALKLGRSFSLTWQALDIPRAKAYLLQAEHVIARSADTEVAGRMAVALGTAAIYDGDLDLVAESSARAMELGRRLPSDVLLAAGESLSGWWLMSHLHTDEARVALDDAWRIADRIGHVATAFGASWIGAGWAMFTDVAYALTLIERERCQARQAQASNTRHTLDVAAYVGLMRSGRLDDARRLQLETDFDVRLLPYAHMGDEVFSVDWASAEVILRERLELLRRVGNLVGVEGTASDLGRLHARMGDVERARAELSEALSVSRSSGGTFFELLSRARLASVHVAAGDLDAARREVARCEEIVASATGRAVVPLSGLAVARGALAAAEGRHADAATDFATAVETNRAASYPWGAAEALQAWGRGLLLVGDRPGAIEKLDAALEIYTTMGVGEPWTDHVLTDRRRAA